MTGRIREWAAEAGRRRVFRTVGVYVVAVWGVSSGGVDIAGVLGIPESALRIAIYAAVGAIPFVALLAWRFDIGREGIVRDPQDVLAEARAEADLAAMPTVLGGDDGAGAMLVRWHADAGEQSALFTEAFVLGRGADCRVRFYDPLVYREHARVFPDETGAWWIEDLESRNGTRVAGEPIRRLALDERIEVRLTDEAPPLELERIAPGAPTLSAMAEFAPGSAVAHVRPRTTRGETRDG